MLSEWDDGGWRMKMLFKIIWSGKDSKRTERAKCGERTSQEREQQGERPEGGRMLYVFQEEQGTQGGWKRMSEGERNKR